MTTDIYPLFELLESRDIGIKALSRLTGMNKRTIQRVFRRQPVTFITAYQIAEILGASLLDMFEDASTSVTNVHQIARQGHFTPPPYPDRPSRQGDWERIYGDCERAQMRRDEHAARD